MQTAQERAEAYDAEAEATGWFGPEIVFGLAYGRVSAGQSMLDLGIGTGLGSALFRKAGLDVCGVDRDPVMLEACACKGVERLVRHDLDHAPYPFADESVDHAVCTGVLPFFPTPETVFAEAARIVRKGGLFGIVFLDRAGDQESVWPLGPEVHGARGVTLYRRSLEEMSAFLERSGFTLLRHCAFMVHADSQRRVPMPSHALLARVGRVAA